MNRTEQLKDSTIGYSETLNKLQAARVEKILNEMFRYTEFDESKAIYSRKAFIVNRLELGCTPKFDTYNEYSSKHERVIEKSRYIMLYPHENLCCEITKTEYNFVIYLLNEIGLKNIDSFIEKENAEKEAARLLKIKEEQAQKDADEKAELEEEEYKIWFREQCGKYDNEITIDIQKAIFLDTCGSYSDHAKGLLVLIDNIDNQLCRKQLISWLNNGNKASIKTFEHITGIILEKTAKKRILQLENIKKSDYASELIAYKARKKPVKSGFSDKFYIAVSRNGGLVYEERYGLLWKCRGYDFYIEKIKEGFFRVSEGKTGSMFLEKRGTLSDTYTETKNKIDRIGTLGLDNYINEHTKKHGISPLYQNS